MFLTDGCIRLIHSSVKDFLLRPKNQWIDNFKNTTVAQFRVDPELVYRSLATLSLSYLEVKGEDVALVRSDSLPAFYNGHPFLEYAAIYAACHVNHSGTLGPVILHKFQAVLQSPGGSMWIEHFTTLLIEDPSLEPMLEEILTLKETILNANLNIRIPFLCGEFSIDRGAAKAR